MKIGYVSDLHLDCDSDPDAFIASLRTDVDVMIIAGDVQDGSYDVELLHSLMKHYSRVPTIYVPGNHEFYHGPWPEETEERLRDFALKFPNLHILMGDSVQIPWGPRIVGTTLWYRATPDMELRHKNWPDFRVIRDIVPFTNSKWMEDTSVLFRVRPNDIVVTHMLPSEQCIDQRYAGANTNELFVRQCDDIINKCRPSFWIHGHTHASIDCFIGQTHVLCNPRGIGRENPAFDANKFFVWEPILDVSDVPEKP